MIQWLHGYVTMSRKNVHVEVDSRSIIDRVKEISGLSLKAIASQIFNISDKNLSNKIRRGSIDFFALIKWAGNLSVNLNWLLTGEGDPYVTETTGTAYVDNPETAEILEMTRQVVESETHYSDSLKADIRSFHDAMLESRRIRELERRIVELEAGREARGDSKGVSHYDGPERRKGQRRIKDDPEAIPGKKDRRSGVDRRVIVLEN